MLSGIAGGAKSGNPPHVWKNAPEFYATLNFTAEQPEERNL
jgi:hypothetical protein